MQRVHETVTDASEVRGEIIDTEAVALAVAEHHVHRPRCRALHARDVFAVEAQLQQEVRLGVARELGVFDLVVPWPAAAGQRLVDAAQEIRVPDPRPVEERRLVDDLRACRHRCFGGARRRLELANAFSTARVARPVDGDDVVSVGAQPLEIGRLVLLAQVRKQLRLLGALVRPGQGAAQRLEVERREVLAGEEVVEIGRGENDRVVEQLQRTRLLYGPDSTEASRHLGGTVP